MYTVLEQSKVHEYAIIYLLNRSNISTIILVYNKNQIKLFICMLFLLFNKLKNSFIKLLGI